MMEEHTNGQQPSSAADEVYEKMYALLYAYRFGTIGFLELLEALEAILHIKTPSDQSDVA